MHSSIQSIDNLLYHTKEIKGTKIYHFETLPITKLYHTKEIKGTKIFT